MTMRSIIIAFSLLLSAAMLLTSCTREYVCSCTSEHYGAPGMPQSKAREYTISNTQKNAREICQDNSEIFELDGYITVEKCKLK